MRLILGLAAAMFAAGTLFAAPLKTERLVLITADGLRHQELFRGVDPLLLNEPERAGVHDADGLKEAYWRESDAERRRALMPFFWDEFVSNGVLLGNPEKNSHVRVLNPNRVSYPGYAEMVTGKTQKRIWGNMPVPMPQTTVLELIQQERGLGYRDIALFASWKILQVVGSKAENAFPVNAGYQPADPTWKVPGMDPLDALQFDMRTPFPNTRFDAVTANFALEYLQAHKPVVLWIALGETDDWAHRGFYDRVVNAAHHFDKVLGRLWSTLQAMEEYRDKTTVVVTTDHGRGTTLENWITHSRVIDGSQDVFVAVRGPDTPALGEAENTPDATNAQLATTLGAFMGVDYAAAYPDAAPPLPLVLPSE